MKMMLPHSAWLQRNGYSALQQAMLFRPDLFKHIPQAWLGGKPAVDWIPVAEQLAQANKGLLPTHTWLRSHGYGGLADALHREKDAHLFAHIPKEVGCRRGSKGLEHWRLMALQLAEKHGGVLPSKSDLERMRLFGLTNALQRHPQMFAGIKQEKRIARSVDETVEIAEHLAKQHDGFLPTRTWLEDNGYAHIYNAVYKYPQRFKHLKRLSLRRGPREWVAWVQEYIERSGRFPTYSQRPKGLQSAIYRQPQLFIGLLRKINGQLA